MNKHPRRQQTTDEHRQADHRVIEWKECRATVARFEKIIVDLRKYGFILLAALLTAKALFFLNSSPSDKGALTGAKDKGALTEAKDKGALTEAKDKGAPTELTLQTRIALMLFTMVLIFALFVVDLSQEVLLRAARRRAIALETDLRMELSSVLKEQAIGPWVHSRGIWLYSSLVLASFLASVLTTIRMDGLLEKHYSIFFTIIFLITVLTLGLLYWHHVKTRGSPGPTDFEGEP
jgi:hypothetical protein